MDFNHLRVFVTVADLGSFGRAAAALDVSQPAISQQVSALEQRLGTALFLRGPSGVRLTPEGRVILDEARASVAQADRALEVAYRTGAGELGHLTIAYIDSALFTESFRRILGGFRRQYPGVELELLPMNATSHMTRLLGGEIDFAFVRGPLPPASQLIRTVHISRDAVCLAMSAGHPLARQEAVCCVDFASEPLIVTGDPQGLGFCEMVVSAIEAHGIAPHIVEEVPELLAAALLVRAGVGVTVLPAPMAQLAIPGLEMRPITDMPETDLFLLGRAAADQPVARNFRRMVQSAR